jgi:acyl-lipid omega-6 desaturase (Delta-12 desaturase)
VPVPLPSPSSSFGAPSEPDSAFGKAEYVALKRTLKTRPSTLISLCVVAVMATLATAGIWLSTGDWPAFLLSQVVLAIVFFQGFALLHECGHGVASSSNVVNVALGHLASAVCLLPFYPWRYIHQQHHLHAGNLENDPVLASIKRWRQAGRIHPVLRVAWRTGIPLLALVQHLVFWSYPLQLARRRDIDRRQLMRCGLSVLFLVAVYATVMLFAGQYLHFRRFALALVIYLVATEAVNLPHHVGAPVTTGRLAPWQQWQSTRSCRYPRGLSELLVLNFNYHVEHHVFPALPWFRLRAAHHLLRRSLGSHYREESGVSWSFRSRAHDLTQVIIPEVLLSASEPAPTADVPRLVLTPTTRQAPSPAHEGTCCR